MKKVAIVINTSWNIYNFRLSLVKALQAIGLEVYAVAPPDKYSSLLQENGCKFYPLKMDGSGANLFTEAGTLLQLYNVYREIMPDVILHYTIKPNLYGTMAARALNIPVINNVSGLGTAFLSNSAVARVARNLYRIIFRYPKKVFFQNEDDRQLFLNYRLVRPEITEVIPGSGVNIQHFCPTESPPNKEFTFLVIARLLIDKGIHEYTEAIKILKQQGIMARFLLLGAAATEHRRGVREETIRAWAKDGPVEYLGPVDNVLPYIHQADCVVLPSYREGTPRSLLEGAACGKPLIATDVPGCNNVVQENINGFLCRAEDAEDLAEKMNKMLSLGTEKLKEFGINSRRLVTEKFDENIVIERYIMAIHKIDG